MSPQFRYNAELNKRMREYGSAVLLVARGLVVDPKNITDVLTEDSIHDFSSVQVSWESWESRHRIVPKRCNLRLHFAAGFDRKAVEKSIVDGEAPGR